MAETFRPQCPGGKSDIIVITGARFGRMKFGRCVEEDPGLVSVADNPRFLGCSADVKSILDKQCSGLTECEVKINNQNFEGIKPCMTGLTMYLEASYSCVKGSSILVYRVGKNLSTGYSE
jgi:Galactose binding lectin domain